MLHKDVSLLSLAIFAPTPNIVTTVNDIMAKHYQHFKTTRGYLSVWKKVVCLPRNGAISSKKLDIKNAKVIGNDGFGYRQEFEQFCPLLLRCWDPKEISTLDNAFGDIGTLGIDWAIVMTMQLSLTTMKTVSACEQALHLNDIERSSARVARERRHGSKVRGRH